MRFNVVPDRHIIAHLIAAAHDRIAPVVTPISEDYVAADSILNAFGAIVPRVGLEGVGSFAEVMKRKLNEVILAFPNVKITIVHDEIVFSGPDASAATGMYLDIKPHIPKYIRAVLERRRNEFKRFRASRPTSARWSFPLYERDLHYTEGINRITDFLGTEEDLAVEFSTMKTGRPSWRLKP